MWGGGRYDSDIWNRLIRLIVFFHIYRGGWTHSSLPTSNITKPRERQQMFKRDDYSHPRTHPVSSGGKLPLSLNLISSMSVFFFFVVPLILVWVGGVFITVNTDYTQWYYLYYLCHLGVWWLWKSQLNWPIEHHRQCNRICKNYWICHIVQ
jgi:hypothetical protein